MRKPGVAEQILRPLAALQKFVQQFLGNGHRCFLLQKHGPAQSYTKDRTLSETRAFEIDVPRDREGSFEPRLIGTPAMLEFHYGVPMCGAVLHSINTQLDAAIIAFQLDHAMSKVVIVDREFMPLMQEAIALATASLELWSVWFGLFVDPANWSSQ